MQLGSVVACHRRRAFDVEVDGRTLSFPYSKAHPSPSPLDRVVRTEAFGNQFTYVLESGRRGAVHVEQVFEHNEDPRLLRDIVLYQLTLEALRRVSSSRLSKREIVRRLATSPAQLYRLLDPCSDRKSVDQLLALLHVLDCEVELVVRSRGD